MLQYGICNLSIVPLRAEASDRSEMVSQLLFGEGFEILEETEKWVRVKTSFDNYEGWIDHKQFKVVDSVAFEDSKNFRALNCATVHQVKKLTTGEIINLTAGASIPVNSTGSEFSIGDDRYELDLSTHPFANAEFSSSIESYSKFFLQSPYLWGGRSLFGIDCSGFTQIVFKMLGLKLNRDAWQQAEQGTTVDFLQEVNPGDLAFFDNAEGRITHVGIMLDDHTIIHASGRVKIDPLDDEGIYSLDLKKHTHKLRIIKRLV